MEIPIVRDRVQHSAAPPASVRVEQYAGRKRFRSNGFGKVPIYGGHYLRGQPRSRRHIHRPNSGGSAERRERRGADYAPLYDNGFDPVNWARWRSTSSREAEVTIVWFSSTAIRYRPAAGRSSRISTQLR